MKRLYIIILFLAIVGYSNSTFASALYNQVGDNSGVQAFNSSNNQVVKANVITLTASTTFQYSSIDFIFKNQSGFCNTGTSSSPWQLKLTNSAHTIDYIGWNFSNTDSAFHTYSIITNQSYPGGFILPAGSYDLLFSASCSAGSGNLIFKSNATNVSFYGAITNDGVGGLATQESHVVSFTPVNTVTASTTVTMTAEIYVNDLDPDFSKFQYIEFDLINYETGFQYTPIYLPITASGGSSVSTTTVLTQGGHSMLVSFYGVNEGVTYRTHAKVFGFGVVTSTNPVDNDGAVTTDCTGLSGLDALTCNVGNFFTSLFISLFVPNGTQIDYLVGYFKDSILTKFPWGYLTRTYEIYTDSTIASSSVPALVNVPIIYGGGTTTISFDPISQLGGAGSFIEPAVTQILPYWDRFWDIIFIGWLLSFFFGLRRNAHHKEVHQ